MGGLAHGHLGGDQVSTHGWLHPSFCAIKGGHFYTLIHSVEYRSKAMHRCISQGSEKVLKC